MRRHISCSEGHWTECGTEIAVKRIATELLMLR